MRVWQSCDDCSMVRVRIIIRALGNSARVSMDDEADFDVVVRKMGSTTIVRLFGEFDYAAAESHADALACAVTVDGDVVIDLGELTYLDSCGLRFFVAMLNEHGSSLSVRNAYGAVRRVLALTGLDEVLGLEPI
jgi:anti-anti-sigma factor